MQGGLKNHS